ncbi:MAG TPA: hypothetical protein PKD96_04875 [Candidatus Absconditabacterales bacterium]|nr:hypothetical protein [Candidatus Absconditabacterales bacterium]HMT27616.1 hypothetical protein [Candidatus Absconditabacterales bacterium]
MRKLVICGLVAIIVTLATSCTTSMSALEKEHPKKEEETKQRTWGNPRFGGLVFIPEADFI